ncbi:MAG: aminoadenine-incorporating DNA polymerase DpoZ [Spirochaetales bacterium]|jgi:DNA polymerase I-like protein with 3'-5' exonuclease and polymerase domains|nr:aminoadenine-incorporating DNA polymerase DpoZ [Spirochaetales bacterium]
MKTFSDFMKFPNLQQFDRFAYDTETDGLRYKINKAFSFSSSTPDGKDYYYDIREEPNAIDWINDQFSIFTGIVICHNASFDFRMSESSGIRVPVDRLDDTVTRACLIDEHLFEYSLDSLCKKYLGVGKYGDIYRELANMFGGMATRNVQMPRLHKAPSSMVAQYAKMDTSRTLELWDWQQTEIERQGIQDIVKFELDLMPTFIRAEMRGIRVDLDYAEEAREKLTPVIDGYQSELNKIAGFDINVNSSPQIKKMFAPVQDSGGNWFTKDGIAVGKTPNGNASINADILREMQHPAARHILDLRSLLKTRDTFLGKHVLEHAVGERVYPNINQNKGEDGGTGTGRLSYTEPAMQQIPTRNKEVAAIVKPCFLPDEGCVWVDSDMASFEVRSFAHLVENKEIIEAYRNDPSLDLHQYVADITGLVRNATYSGQPNAKQLNLSMIFNSGRGAIADKMGMPWTWETFLPRNRIDVPENWITYKKAGTEAMAVIEKYHDRVGGVMELMGECKREAEREGYVSTGKGRHLRFPNGHKSYSASGIKIQATAADWNKENWKMIEEELGNEGHLILNTHDSYSLNLPEDWEPYYNRVAARLQDSSRAKVPLILDWSGAGYNWHQALQGKNYARKTKRSRAIV